MKKGTKIVLGGAAAATGLLLVLGAGKASRILEVNDALKYDFRTISGIAVDGFPNYKARLSIYITNPTRHDFSVDGYGLVRLKSVNVTDVTGSLIASGDVDIPNISIAAGQTIKMDNIPIRIQGAKALQLAQQLLAGGSFMNSFSITGTYEVMGSNIVI